MRAQAALASLSLVALSSLSGCVYYNGDLKIGDECDPGEPCWGWEDSGLVEEPEIAWTLDPSVLSPGDTRIVSVTAEPLYPYLEIADVELYGDVTLCTFEATEAELQVVVSVAQDAPEGTVDLLLVTMEGDGIWLEDALSVAWSPERPGAEEDPEGEDPTGEDPAEGEDDAPASGCAL